MVQPPMIVPHVDKTEIGGLTKNNAYHTVDVSALLQYSGAKGILLQYVNNNAGSWYQAGYRSTGDATARDENVEATTACIFIAKLDSNGQFDYRLQNASLDAFILAEFHGNGIVIFGSDDWVSRETTGNQWKDFTITVVGGDSVSDVECGLLSIYKESGTKNAGLRMKGATVEPIYATGSRTAKHPLFTLPVKVDSDGKYQFYWSQGECELINVWGREQGYIKKGYGFHAIEDPVDEEIPENTSWEDYTLDLIPRFSKGAYVLVKKTATGTGTGGVRDKSSSNVADEVFWSKWHPQYVQANIDKEIQARHGTGDNVEFLVWGYLTDVPEGIGVLIIDTTTVTIDTGTLNIG